MPRQTVHVLLVEDDEIDAEEMVRAFQRLQITNPLTIVANGDEALNTLRGTSGFPRLPRPYVLIIDLNMPRMNGLELLQCLRADEQLQQSVVFVLTTSNRDADKGAAYALHVAGYFVKDRDAGIADEVLTMLAAYCQLVAFPPDHRQGERVQPT